MIYHFFLSCLCWMNYLYCSFEPPKSNAILYPRKSSLGTSLQCLCHFWHFLYFFYFEEEEEDDDEEDEEDFWCPLPFLPQQPHLFHLFHLPNLHESRFSLSFSSLGFLILSKSCSWAIFSSHSWQRLNLEHFGHAYRTPLIGTTPHPEQVTPSWQTPSWTYIFFKPSAEQLWTWLIRHGIIDWIFSSTMLEICSFIMFIQDCFFIFIWPWPCLCPWWFLYLLLLDSLCFP